MPFDASVELICGLTKTNTELLFMEDSTQPSFLFASLCMKCLGG